MKDAYTFDLRLGWLPPFLYNREFTAYLRTFARPGRPPFRCGRNWSRSAATFSHEFIILASTGESEVFCHRGLSLVQDASSEDIDFGNAETMAVRRQMDLRSTPPPPGQTRCGRIRKA